jgi:hypothetical protein
MEKNPVREICFAGEEIKAKDLGRHIANSANIRNAFYGGMGETECHVLEKDCNGRPITRLFSVRSQYDPASKSTIIHVENGNINIPNHLIYSAKNSLRFAR